MNWHPDPEFSAIVFGGMIQRLREEVGLIDWKHMITTAVITGVTTVGIGYITIRDALSDHQAQIAEIKTLISARVAQRESQLSALAEEDRQIRGYVSERVDAVRSDLVTLREAMGMCREQLAALRAAHTQR